MTVAELMKIVEEPLIQGRRIAGGRLQMRDEDWESVVDEMIEGAEVSSASYPSADAPLVTDDRRGTFMGVPVFVGYSETRFVEGLPD